MITEMIDKTLQGRELSPATLTGRVLLRMRALKHWARSEFIAAGEDYENVKIVLDNLYEDGIVEHRLDENQSYWRIKRAIVLVK